MVKHLIVISLVLLVTSHKIYAEPPSEGYFPPLAFRSDKESDDFMVRWYSRHLFALEEPSLLKLSEDKKLQCYRFLWLRTFDPPISLRLNVDPEGTGLLIVKMSDGAGGYGPGKLITNETLPVNRKQVATFLQLLGKLSFWQQPTSEKSNVIGLDGAQWILEGVLSGKYHVVDRWSPHNGIYRDTALFLVTLAKLKVKAVY